MFITKPSITNIWLMEQPGTHHVIIQNKRVFQITYIYFTNYNFMNYANRNPGESAQPIKSCLYKHAAWQREYKPRFHHKI